jgi:hypothetical protein
VTVKIDDLNNRNGGKKFGGKNWRKKLSGKLAGKFWRDKIGGKLKKKHL